MLSDSVWEAIQYILEAIHHYREPPFEYGSEYRSQFIIALANLLFIQHSLDLAGREDIHTLDMCFVEANQLFDSSSSSSSEDEKNDSGPSS